MLIYYHKKRKKGIPIKSKYTKEVNINLNRTMGREFDKYTKDKHIKLFTNDVKVALFTAPITFIMGMLTTQDKMTSDSLYIISGCALVYAAANLYSHSKKKQKRFTLK